MSSPLPLSSEALYTACNPADLGFDSSEEVAPPDADAIHPRALEALRLGLDIPHKGYNLFVLGDSGSGRHAITRQLLETERHRGSPPADWCHVHNFVDPFRPALLRLPCGRGARLRDDMQRFVDELMTAITTVFESDDYRARIEAMQQEEKEREERALQRLGQDASELGVALLRTPHGFAFVPVKGEDGTLTPKEFEALPAERQEELGRHIKQLHDRMHALMNEFPRWRRELQARIKAAGSEALRVTVTQLTDELRERYADLPAVVAFLDAVTQDVIDSGEQLRESSRADEDSETVLYKGTISVQRYLINLLVENAPEAGRPVVYEDHPTLQNLVGRVDHMVHMGTLVSNFTLIRAGALQRANGGFLILDALKVIAQPYAWEGLKRTLQAGEVRIESLAELIGLSSTLQLEPEPVPLELKVVLIGERLVYYLLCRLDPEFEALFKIGADFESELPRNPANTASYARLLAGLARQEGLRPLEAPAVARMIEHAARLAGDAEQLSTRTRPLEDLLQEADHFAAAAGAARIGRAQVETALAARRRRHDRIRERFQREILRGQLLVDTEGSQTGQINGLAVVALGDSSFAHPVRITATVRMGEGEVVDIEREVALGGPIHSKGVLILSAFLSARFGARLPLSLKASLVFEQSYGGVEGDSASLAEAVALLSALSGVPIRQGLAVTGSVNQFGVVQAVGGINEKIEGFFDICARRGLSGEQGVLIPAANVCHLMLRADVREAASAGRFRIWAIRSVDEAIELLTGEPAGAPDADGLMAPGSVNGRAAARLAELARARQEFAHPRQAGAGPDAGR
ncbi:MAG: AAA family ATPase [Thauera phenolivorans]|uniref:endopeptidase La n=1 Tax=Thauera phenolivorans TaxID=1792543 RepID=A0A7X7LYI4_9RHOO|nr:AAA family ATPase [Thauera phenolivorans]